MTSLTLSLSKREPRARGSTRSPRAIVVLIPLLCAACGPRLMKLPSGPGTAAPDFGAAQVQATEACRNVNSLSAEVAVKGSVAGERLRGRLIGGFTAQAARLEAPAPFGAPIFIFVARN